MRTHLFLLAGLTMLGTGLSTPAVADESLESVREKVSSMIVEIAPEDVGASGIDGW